MLCIYDFSGDAYYSPRYSDDRYTYRHVILSSSIRKEAEKLASNMPGMSEYLRAGVSKCFLRNALLLLLFGPWKAEFYSCMGLRLKKLRCRVTSLSFRRAAKRRSLHSLPGHHDEHGLDAFYGL